MDNKITLDTKDLELIGYVINKAVEKGLDVVINLSNGSSVVVYKTSHAYPPVYEKPETIKQPEPITTDDEVIKWIQDNTNAASTQQRVYKLYMAYMMQNQSDITVNDFRDKLSTIHKVWKTAHNNWFTNAKLKGLPSLKMDKIESIIDIDAQILKIESEETNEQMDSE